MNDKKGAGLSKNNICPICERLVAISQDSLDPRVINIVLFTNMFYILTLVEKEAITQMRPAGRDVIRRVFDPGYGRKNCS